MRCQNVRPAGVASWRRPRAEIGNSRPSGTVRRLSPIALSGTEPAMSGGFASMQQQTSPSAMACGSNRAQRWRATIRSATRTPRVVMLDFTCTSAR
jgi:hypothetical protein